MPLCTFEDKKMQKKFDRWREPLQLRQIYVISILTAILYIIMSFVDMNIAPKQAINMMVNVHLFMVPTILLVIAILAFFKKHYSLMTILLIIAPIIAAVGNILIVSNFQGYSIYSNEIYLIIFWIFTVSGLKLVDAIISATLIIFISIIGTYTTSQLQLNELIMHIFWMLSSISFGIFGKYLLEHSNKTIFLKHEQLSLELNNKNILLRELFHRVKNNLQIIASLLSIQSKKIEDKKTKDTFKNSIQTIKSMSIIHEKLYKSDNLEAIDFNDYLSSLISNMKQNIGGNDVKFNIKCDNMMISLDNAIPLGLIINEVITNSIKYAFEANDDNNKVIDIQMYKNSLEELILELSDNGKGIDFNIFEKGFGFKLIDSLVVQQLKGTLEYFNKDGLFYVLKFNEKILMK